MDDPSLAVGDALDPWSDTEPDEPPERCPFCGEEIPLRRRELHAAGLDARALECPHQSIEDIIDASGARPRDWLNVQW